MPAPSLTSKEIGDFGAGAFPRLPMRWAIGVVIFIAAINFILMPRLIASGDPWAWREEARSMIASHALAVDPSCVAFLGDPGQYFVQNAATQKWYSKYGIMNSLMSLPPTFVEWFFGELPPPHSPPNVLIFNLYNLLLCVLTALVLLKITGRYTSRNWLRTLYILACMYATYLWFYQRAQSSEIYQVMFFAAGYGCLMESTKRSARNHFHLYRPALTGAWICWGALILTRIVFGILIPVVWLTVGYSAWRAGQTRDLRKAIASLLIPPLLILLLLGWINWIKFGSPFLLGYHQWHVEQHHLTGNCHDGVYGFLFSTRWSIFLYFPILFFALPGVRRFMSDYTVDAVAIFSAFIISLFVIGSIPTWRGEWTYGPRYLIFILPVLALPALVFFDSFLGNESVQWKKWALAGVVSLTLGYSLWLQWQTNRLDFWTVHRLAGPFENGGMNLDTYRYFNDHMEGTILGDLERNADHLENSQLMQQLDRILDSRSADQYKEAVNKMLRQTNFYWWPPTGNDASDPVMEHANGV